MDRAISDQVKLAILAEVFRSSDAALRAYLDSASRDGTFNLLHRTWRVSQRGTAWLDILQVILDKLGRRSWIYREGTRSVFTLETTADLRSRAVADDPHLAAAFVRGYFDAEGGVPRDPQARFYVQFVQRDLLDLATVRESVMSLGIECGRLHNPSFRVDPEYWRFYVRAASAQMFIESVGSWHPRKRIILEARTNPRLVNG